MVAKGFRGKYFTLQAITATTAVVKEQQRASAFETKRLYHYLCFKEEDPPPLEKLQPTKPCYCNIFFTYQAHKALRLSRIKKPPLCRCRKTKTGIAPPHTQTPIKLLTHLKKKLGIERKLRNFVLASLRGCRASPSDSLKILCSLLGKKVHRAPKGRYTDASLSLCAYTSYELQMQSS